MLSKDLVDDLGVADVVDAMALAFQHRAHLIGLDSPNPHRVLFGPAVTIAYMPVRKDLMDPARHSLGPAFYRAIGDDDPTGKVLVMASNGYAHASLGGGTKLSRVRNHNMDGILSDGHLRDYDELTTFDFAVYCKGETVRAGGNEVQPYLADVPVCVDGVTVIPGDYVFAAGSTAVIIPAGSAEAILEKSRAIKTDADAARDSLAGEDPKAVLSQGSSEL